MVAIRQQWALAGATGATAKQMGALANAFKSAKDSAIGLFSNPWTWVFVGIMAVTDLVNQLSSAREAMHELNDDIKKNAGEASESMLSFLNNKGNIATVNLARQNKLTAEQGEKAWETFREQINQSALSANSLIAELQAIPNVNERIAKSFDYAERIQKAQAALQDLQRDSIKVSEDFGWFGVLGEGLVSDLIDYTNTLEKYTQIGKEAQLTTEGLAKWMESVGEYTSDKNEFLEELDEVAQSINNFIQAYNITDPLQINEILERVRAQIKAKNPKIKGDFAKIFDTALDERMYALTNGAVDKNTSLWKIFMDRLRHNSSAAFQDVTDDWVKSSDKLSTEQQKAIDENLKYFKDTMPMYYNAVSDMVADASKLKIQIGIAFNTKQVTDFQREVNKRMDEANKNLDFGGSAYLPTSNDDLVSWVDTQQKAIKKLGEENKKYEKDNTEWSKKKISDNNREIEQRKNLLALFHQSYEAEKKTKNTTPKGRKPEDIVAEALKQELSIIKEMQSNYSKLRKAGVSDTDALRLSTQGYELTLSRVNNVLQKFGISKFNASNFAGKNVRQLLDSLTKQRDELLASGKVKDSSLKDLDVEIQKLTIDAKTYDMQKITEGLNNELGKLKDEYELAIELDASPELGDMFADMFDIDMESLPRSFGEALDRAQQIIDTKLSELNVRQPFDLLRTQIESIGVGEGKTKGFAELAGLDMKGDAIQGLLKWQQTFRDMFKKNITETEKMLDDYVKKYGGYADRMAEIEADRLQKVKRLNEAYYTEEMRRLPEYVAKMSAIEKGAEKERGKVKFDEFKDSRLYVAMFENLEYASTATLEAIREKLQGLKDDMGQLTPEQLKQVTQQFEKIDRELLRRNPFKGLIKNAKEYAKALGADGKKAQETFRTAQRKYDWELGTLTALKEQLEQKKAQEPLDVEGRKRLEEQVSEQQKKVDLQKEELEKAEALNGAYAMMRKLLGEQADAILETIKMIAQNLQSLGELRDTLQETFSFEFSHSINGAIDSLMKVGSGLSKVASSAQSKDAVGFVTGVVQTAAGIGDTIASIFGDGAARTRRINREIENSVEVVRRLNMAYKELERQVTHAMGAEELRARRSQIENKKAQLAELERQMQLEQSKRSKDRDDDAIKQYEESIQDLRYEIADLVEDITNTLLGSDLKGASEEFVSVWVDAWRQGGDTMDALKGKFDDMIDTMIAKSLASRLVSERLEGIWKAVKAATSDLSEGGVDITMDELQKIRDLIGDKTIAEQINDDLTKLYGALNIAYGSGVGGGKNLSALQQGLQGITEETAGALEAMMNGMSQQIYLHSDLLTQIRDTLIGFDMDVQTGALSQILLQLQSSYQVQMSIHGILEGVLNPSGRAFNVELLS